MRDAVEDPHRLLVVDNSPTTRAYFQQVFGEDQAVTCVETCQQFMERISKEEFDLVFVDLWLGDQSGLDLLQTIDSGTDAFSTIAMSAYADRGIKNAAMDHGAVQFLEKPFSADGLRDCLTLSRGAGETVTEAYENRNTKIYSDVKVQQVTDDATFLKLAQKTYDEHGIRAETIKSMEGFLTEPLPVSSDILVFDLSFALKNEKTSEALDKLKRLQSTHFIVLLLDQSDSLILEDLPSDLGFDIFIKPFDIHDYLQSISRISFNLQSKKQEASLFEEEASPYRTVTKTLGNWKEPLLIGLIFVVLGLGLGFFVSWSRGISEDVAGEATNIQEMFDKIDGYLERDERRELDE